MLLARLIRVACAGMVTATTVGACSSDSATRSVVSPNVALMDRFDSLSNVALGDSDLRFGAYSQIAQLLAEGAPVQMATISLNGLVFRDSAVAMLQVNLTNGHVTDSTLFIAMWDGHGPDTTIFIATTEHFLDVTTFVARRGHFTSNGPVFTTATDTLRVTMSAPGAPCASLLAERPPDVNPPAPSRCQLQSVSISYTTLPQDDGQDTVFMPRQTLQNIRAEF